MTHLGGKRQALIVEIFLLADELEPEHIVGVDDVVLQRALLERWLRHCSLLQVLFGVFKRRRKVEAIRLDK